MKKLVAATALLAALAGAGSAEAALYISEIYGGGGSSAGPYFTNDYVQLYNDGPSAINLSGYSLHYASPTSTTAFGATATVAHTLSGAIAANSYFLIQESGSGSVGASHVDPAFDLTGGTIALGNANGKIALFDATYPATAPLSNSGTIGVNGLVDLVGYGTTANYSLYAAMTQSLTISTAAIRTTNTGVTTFVAGTPTPTPTPIPAAAWLLGSGLFGLAGFRRRNV
jgi:hypothetical protein